MSKQSIINDVIKAGCTNVVYVPFGYKPTVHFPEPPNTSAEHRRFDSEVAFVGGCDSDRAPLVRGLVKAIPDLNLALYGGFWNRSPTLRRYWRGLAFGRDFRMAMGGAKIALNLVRRANRDGHVMRSFEIPACGGFMLAERTAEHLAFFGENRECAYFDTLNELVGQIRHYLTKEEERSAIALEGRYAVLRGRHTYSDRLTHIIALIRHLYPSETG